MTTYTQKAKINPGKTPAAKAKSPKWDFRLYVAGHTKKSIDAFKNLSLICEEQLTGIYRIEVIDIWEHPQLARTAQILAVPTLVRKHPLPVRNIIGDLSNKERVLASLGIIEYAFV